MKLNEKDKLGQEIFEKLFSLPDNDLKLKLNDILDGQYSSIINKSFTIIRTIINEVPSNVEIEYYDKIYLNHKGIFYIPEHGGDFLLVKFNKYFKL